jgi:haloacid dehalogenase-like hydrolase
LPIETVRRVVFGPWSRRAIKTLRTFPSMGRHEVCRLHIRLREERRKLYEGKYLASVKAFTGVREVFEALTRGGGTIALATDCKGPALNHYLSLLQVDDVTDSMACGDDVEHGKPDPRLVGLALKAWTSGPGIRHDRRHSLRRGGSPRRRHRGCRTSSFPALANGAVEARDLSTVPFARSAIDRAALCWIGATSQLVTSRA